MTKILYTKARVLLLLVNILLFAFVHAETSNSANGTRWAVLIAGSNDYGNYRHQADLCHAYQILKRGGLKDENIIVFMYDDIANNPENPTPGIIINRPNGENVYKGVLKDYTEKHVTKNNFLNVLLGNKTALTGGSGKVLASGPNDHVFIYYVDHGAPGLLGMPEYEESVYADDLLHTFKQMHAAKKYKRLVFYVEACEAGSLFEGIFPKDLNIYITTASNAIESSYAIFCPEGALSDPSIILYGTCLGDEYSVAWMSDIEKYSLSGDETLKQQYQRVKKITKLSHVMQYGDLKIDNDKVAYYIRGSAKKQLTFLNDDSSLSSYKAVNQRDTDLLHLRAKVQKAPQGSAMKLKAQKKLAEVLFYRERIDKSIKLIGNILFGTEKGNEILNSVRPAGQPVVDDWDCLKSMVKTYETHCGVLTQYGRKHVRAIANICNAGVKKEQMVDALTQACGTVPFKVGAYEASD